MKKIVTLLTTAVLIINMVLASNLVLDMSAVEINTSMITTTTSSYWGGKVVDYVISNDIKTPKTYSDYWQYWAYNGGGCRIAAQTKLLTEANIMSGLNPKAYLAWGRENGYFSKTSLNELYKGGNTGESILGFASQKGIKLLRNKITLSKQNSQSDANEIMKLIRQGYYVIVESSGHQAYIGMDASLRAGQPVILNNSPNKGGCHTFVGSYTKVSYTYKNSEGTEITENISTAYHTAWYYKAETKLEDLSEINAYYKANNNYSEITIRSEPKTNGSVSYKLKIVGGSRTEGEIYDASGKKLVGTRDYSFPTVHVVEKGKSDGKYWYRINEINNLGTASGYILCDELIKSDTYTIKYDANGGNGTKSVTKYENVSIKLPSSGFTKSGYTLAGWSKLSSADSASYSLGASYNDHGDATFYAVWKKVTDTCTCSTSYAGTYTVNDKQGLNIRSGHGSSYDIIGVIPNGTKVNVTKGNGNWAHITYNGISGYCSMNYLVKFTDPVQPSVSIIKYSYSAQNYWASGNNWLSPGFKIQTPGYQNYKISTVGYTIMTQSGDLILSFSEKFNSDGYKKLGNSYVYFGAKSDGSYNLDVPDYASNVSYTWHTALHSLAPGHTYKVQGIVRYDGVLYYSEIYTMTTTGTKNHNWILTNETSANCVSTGMRLYSCSCCNETKTETISALGHTFGTAWQSDATNHWHVCSCGEKGSLAKHTWDSGVVTKPATTTATGIRTYTCTVCKKTKTEAIPISNAGAKFTNASASKGGKITLEFIIENSVEVIALMLGEFEYDSRALTLDYSNVEICTNSLIKNVNEKAGIVIGFESQTRVSGTIVKIPFTVSKNAEDGDYTVGAKMKYQLAGSSGTFDFEIQDGLVSVNSYKRGDTNGDNIVNAEDAIYLMWHTFNPSGYPVTPQKHDYNKDSIVNAEDAIYLMWNTFIPTKYPLD